MSIVIVIDWPAAGQNLLLQSKKVAGQMVLDIVRPLITNPYCTKPASVDDWNVFEVHDVFEHQTPRTSQFMSKFTLQLHKQQF
jgi:hypothetical protein